MKKIYRLCSTAGGLGAGGLGFGGLGAGGFGAGLGAGGLGIGKISSLDTLAKAAFFG